MSYRTFFLATIYGEYNILIITIILVMTIVCWRYSPGVPGLKHRHDVTHRGANLCRHKQNYSSTRNYSADDHFHTHLQRRPLSTGA